MKKSVRRKIATSSRQSRRMEEAPNLFRRSGGKLDEHVQHAVSKGIKYEWTPIRTEETAHKTHEGILRSIANQ